MGYLVSGQWWLLICPSNPHQIPKPQALHSQSEPGYNPISLWSQSMPLSPHRAELELGHTPLSQLPLGLGHAFFPMQGWVMHPSSISGLGLGHASSSPHSRAGLELGHSPFSSMGSGLSWVMPILPAGLGWVQAMPPSPAVRLGYISFSPAGLLPFPFSMSLPISALCLWQSLPYGYIIRFIPLTNKMYLVTSSLSVIAVTSL